MGYYFTIDVRNSFLLTRSVCLFILRVSNLRGKAMIEDLVKCPKEILRKKKPQYKVENRHKRMDVSLSSNDGNTFEASVVCVGNLAAWEGWMNA